jgi:hypothetical protein
LKNIISLIQKRLNMSSVRKSSFTKISSDVSTKIKTVPDSNGKFKL